MGKDLSKVRVKFVRQYIERLTKCLCIQAAYFPASCVVEPKFVLRVALAMLAVISTLRLASPKNARFRCDNSFCQKLLVIEGMSKIRYFAHVRFFGAA